MLKRITDNLYVLSSDTSPSSSLSYLLLERNNKGDIIKRMLIDSGDGTIELGFVPDLCILTHNHMDHTQGVNETWEKVFMHRIDIKNSNAYSYVPPQTQPLSTFTELTDNTLTFGGFQLMILHTPGHTLGSISLYEPNKRILFSGDTWFGDGWYGRTDIGGSAEELGKSVKLLKSLKVDILCPGHIV